MPLAAPENPVVDWRASPRSPRNLAGRCLWEFVWLLLFRPSPRVGPFHIWRRLLLRLFGARIASTAVVYPSARIWAPWNLEMADGAVLGDRAECYCVDRVTLRERAVVSQLAYLCAATRDIRALGKPLVTRPIVVERDAWVCARAFVGPGVTIGAGAVVGACAVVMRSVPEWMIVVGNPAQEVRRRELELSDTYADSHAPQPRTTRR